MFVFFFCSHWSLVDVPLIFFCPADHVQDWQPRILLGMVEARSVNVKKKTGGCSEGLGAFRFFFKQQQQREDDVENHPKSSGNAEVINTKARALGVFLRFQGNTRELQSRD